MDIDELKRFITASMDKLENKIESTQNALDIKFGDLANKVKEDVSAIKSSVIDFH